MRVKYGIYIQSGLLEFKGRFEWLTRKTAMKKLCEIKKEYPDAYVSGTNCITRNWI